MELSRVERWLLSNQLRILSAIDPSQKEHYDEAAEAIESGFELDYDHFAQHVYENVVTKEECEEVVDIMSMFSALLYSYEALEDTSGISENAIVFGGFDANEEPRQYAYARFYCTSKGGRFTNLDTGIGFNSHAPRLGAFRRMLVEWDRSEDKPRLSREDIIRIIAARVHPENR